MKTTPYSKLPPHAYWRRAVAEIAPADIDPMTEPPFRFGLRDKIATAGSCFAQHIGRYLERCGCHFLVAEKPHPFIGAKAADALNYGVYSARYGNVYTSRQLVQLFDRAYGRFEPRENYWREGAGAVVDPFRPQIQPGAFNSERELDHDRDRHFAAVREAFETLDVFIFTLGLTEAWASREDGAVFPLCPGVAGGDYCEKTHMFLNLGADDVVSDMLGFLDRLHGVNPSARVILTVSPVPLAATAERRHVMVSTVYSKSALRVACDVIARRAAQTTYFPSYEIVAGGFSGVDYFAADRRSVTPEGVAHVMQVFDRHFIRRNRMEEALRRAVETLTPGRASEAEAVAAAMRLMCDEEALDMTATTAQAEEQTESNAPEPGPLREPGAS